MHRGKTLIKQNLVFSFQTLSFLNKHRWAPSYIGIPIVRCVAGVFQLNFSFYTFRLAEILWTPARSNKNTAFISQWHARLRIFSCHSCPQSSSSLRSLLMGAAAAAGWDHSGDHNYMSLSGWQESAMTRNIMGFYCLGWTIINLFATK